MTNSPDSPERVHEQRRLAAVYEKRDHMPGHSPWFEQAHLFLMQQRERATLRLLGHWARTTPLARMRILDIGCGGGYWIQQFITWGADPALVLGVDVLASRVREARRRLPGQTGIVRGDALALPIPSGRFDLVHISTVFTSVLAPQLRSRLAHEARSMVAPHGAILWYDFFRNNPRNPNVRRVTKGEIEALFPECTVQLSRVTLAPPLARILARFSWTIARAAEAIPFLRTHYLGLIRPRPHEPAANDA